MIMHGERTVATLTLTTLLLLSGLTPPLSAQQESLRVDGLRQPVEILQDHWGIAHIYAENEHDLFFAQGYSAARNRLFQFEIWRRRATGTVAEILGRRELERDIGARLLRFRGDIGAELDHYHPRGRLIINAFVDGVNAYIAQTERDPSLLPPEFGWLGITPGYWTPEVVISRHQGLVANALEELRIGRAVAAAGAQAVREVVWFHPGEPDLTLDPLVDASLLEGDILNLYSAARSTLRFRPEDLAADVRAEAAEWLATNDVVRNEDFRLDGPVGPDDRRRGLPEERYTRAGSNNWVVSGDLTATGMPFMANDPHRALAAPSLRYYVHLVAPGWNVIGGGEPVLPGVSIGHNEYGAWGLTVFETDGEDLYVYETNPANPRQYRYRDEWVDVTVITETIPVENEAPVTVDLEYTRHGPLLYRDSARHIAVGLRAAWLETGAAPYLASLRMDQARSWEEFREACTYSLLPGENMVWAGIDGTIGWQAVGGAPIRPDWSGMVPVPGDGRFEWDGYLPIRQLPNTTNPEKGFFATANNDLIPSGYPHRNAITWIWSDGFRRDRIDEVLGSGRRLTLADMMALQHDELSIPARTLVPLLRPLRSTDPATEAARTMLLAWNRVLDRTSVAAGIYVEWEGTLRDAVVSRVVPSAARRAGNPQMTRVIDWLLAPDGRFGERPLEARDSILISSLEGAVAELARRFGPDTALWRYGQEAYKHALIRHPMSGAVSSQLRARLDVGPAPRGGYSLTVNATGVGDNQTGGASFRIIANLADWDRSVGTNPPGQSGRPDSPHYRDLFDLWATGRYFPLAYSRSAVISVTEERVHLVPDETPARRQP
jgi:penicillin amidase